MLNPKDLQETTQFCYGLMVAQDALQCLVFSKKTDHLLSTTLKTVNALTIHTDGTLSPTCCTSKPQLVLDILSAVAQKIYLKMICLNLRISSRLLRCSSLCIQNM